MKLFYDMALALSYICYVMSLTIATFRRRVFDPGGSVFAPGEVPSQDNLEILLGLVPVWTAVGIIYPRVN